MLRLKAAASSVEDFTTGTFRPVIGDTANLDPSGVDRVLLCSGKVYYDLVAARESAGDTRTAIVRVEQLYPLGPDALSEAVSQFPDAELVWVQEEPANQGPWPVMALALPEALGRPVRSVTRPASASPSTGSSKKHQAEQRALVEQAFAR
jgi:2-oxoglutarate dehydrogenase E1 component